METAIVYNYKNNDLAPSEKCEVKLQCYFNRKYRFIDTGIYIEPEYWDQETNSVSRKHPQYKVISLSIDNKKHELDNTIYDYERTGDLVFDFNALDQYKRGYKDSIYFSKFILEELKNKKSGMDIKTYQKYKSNASILARLLPDKPVCLVTLADINNLDTNLRKEYADSTVARFNVFVEEYIKKAINKDLLRANPYDRADLNTNRGEGKKTHLTLAEIKALEELKHLTPMQQTMLDRFLYSCYTGLRISDNIDSLRKDIITADKEGLIVDLHTIKGYGSDLIHPLRLMFDGKPEKIALKYINSHQGETLFPRQNRDDINAMLKIFANMAEIDKNLTFHVARHSCATLLAEITQDPFLMMNIMGWKDIRIAMNYVHASKEGTKRQLRVFKGKWKY